MDNIKDKVLIVYHKDDNDGVFSGALIYKYLTKYMYDGILIKKENITLLPADYNMLDELAKDKGKELCPKYWKTRFGQVYMTDISFNDSKVMNRIYNDFRHPDRVFCWIDHHSHAIKKSRSYDYNKSSGIREIDTSALGLVYEYFLDPLRVKENDGKMPLLFQYLAGWDSFNPKRYGFTIDECYGINLAVNAKYLLDFNKVLECIDEVMYPDYTESDNGKNIVSELLLQSETILEYERYRNKIIVEECGDFDWTFNINGKKRKAVALFIQGPTTSKMFESVKDKVDHAIVFKHLPNNKWSGSIYNVRHEDDKIYNLGKWINTICKIGGGHPGAAGFTISNAEFNRWNKNKTVGKE